MNINIFCDHLGMTWGQVNDDRTVALYFYVKNCTISMNSHCVVKECRCKKRFVRLGWSLFMQQEEKKTVFGKRLSVSSLQEVKLPVHYSQMRSRWHARKKSKNILPVYQWKVCDHDLVSGFSQGFSFVSVILDQMSAGRKFLHSSDGLIPKRP